MRKTRTMKTKASLFIILMLLMSFFSFSLSTAPASAQQTGCCELTKPAGGEAALYCKDNVEQANCNGTFHSLLRCSDVQNCKKGVMVCPGGCSANKTNVEAVSNGCVWKNVANTEEVDECKEGCCAIPNKVVCNVEQRIVCEKEAEDPGCSKGICGFQEVIKKDSECSTMCEGQDKGTCVLGESNCKFTTKEGCINLLNAQNEQMDEDINFHLNTFVCKVPKCGTICHNHLGCGLYGYEDKVSWFDNANNQEEYIKDCGGTDYVCEACDSDSCTQINSVSGSGYTAPTSYHNGEIKKGDPYCKTSSCKVDFKTYSGQNASGRGFVTYGNSTQTIQNYRSICYNFFTAQTDQSPLLFGISTGLQNAKIVCIRGEPKLETFGEDRNSIGVMKGTVCSKKENKYGRCGECGKTGNDFITDMFVITTLDTGITELLGGVCTKSKCEGGTYGECTWFADLQSSTSTDRAAGSCNPKYVPGTEAKCGECGAGGDPLLNVCNRAECYSLGNCKFENYDFFNKILQLAARWPIAYYGERVGWVPYECGSEAVIGLIGTASCIFSPSTCAQTDNKIKKFCNEGKLLGSGGIIGCYECTIRRTGDTIIKGPIAEIKTIFGDIGWPSLKGLASDIIGKGISDAVQGAIKR